jgi:hypothetical protein
MLGGQYYHPTAGYGRVGAAGQAGFRVRWMNCKPLSEDFRSIVYRYRNCLEEKPNQDVPVETGNGF